MATKKPLLFFWYRREPDGSIRPLSPNPVRPETTRLLELEAERLIRVAVKRRGRGRPRNPQPPVAQWREFEVIEIQMKAGKIIRQARVRVAAARRRLPTRYSKALDLIERWARVEGWESALYNHARLLAVARAVTQHASWGAKPTPD